MATPSFGKGVDVGSHEFFHQVRTQLTNHPRLLHRAIPLGLMPLPVVKELYHGATGVMEHEDFEKKFIKHTSIGTKSNT
jgi:hypothetical protein